MTISDSKDLLDAENNVLDEWNNAMTKIPNERKE